MTKFHVANGRSTLEKALSPAGSSRPLPTIPMGSKTSKAKCPASADTKPVVVPVVPRIPQEIIDEILGYLVSAVPLPHCLLRFGGYGEMAQEVPSTGEESRPPRQGFALLA